VHGDLVGDLLGGKDVDVLRGKGSTDKSKEGKGTDLQGGRTAAHRQRQEQSSGVLAAQTMAARLDRDLQSSNSA
jgi:hypothetical protein